MDPYEAYRESGRTSSEKLGYSHEVSQVLRYQMLHKYVDTTGKRVIDFGAGLGDLYFDMFRRGRLPRAYRGIERNHENCIEAKKRADALIGRECRKSKLDVNFYMSTDMVTYEADLVTCLAVLGLKEPGESDVEAVDRFRRTIMSLWAFVEDDGVLVVDVRRAGGTPEDIIAVVSDSWLAQLASHLTPRFILDCHSAPHFGMLILYKNPQPFFDEFWARRESL